MARKHIPPAHRWALAASLSFGLLGGCATLPAEEATAFHKIAAANRDGFGRLTRQDAQSVAELVSRQIGANVGQLSAVGCDPDADASTCTLPYQLDGHPIDLAEPAPDTRRLIGAIATYGDRMEKLAVAKDLDELGEDAGAAGRAVTSLASFVPGIGPAVGVITSASVKLFKGRMVERRRALLRANARAAAPVIAAAATRMGELAALSRNHILLSASDGVRAARRGLRDAESMQKEIDAGLRRYGPGAARNDPAAQTQLERIGDRRRMIEERRARLADQLIDSARALNAAKGIGTDFTGLARAHELLVRNLDDPSVSIDAALDDLEDWLERLDDLAAAIN